jgi:DNA-directed RNA polymerase specialized sigma24 family protein
MYRQGEQCASLNGEDLVTTTGFHEAAEMLVDECISTASREGLRRFPQLRRWEMTGDVVQSAAASLWQAVRNGIVRPKSPLHLQNLARLHVKWTLLTLARQHSRSIRSQYATPGSANCAASAFRPAEAVCDVTPPGYERDWMSFHAAVHELPDQQRQVFESIWYDGHGKAAVAESLNLSLRAVQRAYRRACEALISRLPAAFFPPNLTERNGSGD